MLITVKQRLLFKDSDGRRALTDKPGIPHTVPDWCALTDSFRVHQAAGNIEVLIPAPQMPVPDLILPASVVAAKQQAEAEAKEAERVAQAAAQAEAEATLVAAQQQETKTKEDEAEAAPAPQRRGRAKAVVEG